jgi:hypothetical protein
MLRLFASASIFVIALGLAGLPARAQSSLDATSKSLRVAQNVSPTQLEEQQRNQWLAESRPKNKNSAVQKEGRS